MIEKKKILYITLRSDYGGATMHIDQLIQNFDKDYEIYCAASIKKPYGIKWHAKLGDKKFFELPFRSFSVKHFIRLIFFIKRNKIDIIHAHGKGAGIYARLAKIFTMESYLIFTFHGLHIEKYNMLMKRFYISLERILSKLTDRFINVSNGEKQHCVDNKLFKASKSLVIYNALENDGNIYPAKYELRKKLNLPVDKFIILSVLRFDKVKNIPAMLDIGKKISDDRSFILILIGDGEEKSSTEKKISANKIENVKLLGFQNNVNEYLHAADLFISTSLWEGLPYSLLEAIRAGLPIIASDVTGNNEVVIDKQNGYLFQLADIDSAVHLLKELKKSSKTLAAFGQSSKSIFEKYFTLHVMINKLKQVYSLKM